MFSALEKCCGGEKSSSVVCFGSTIESPFFIYIEGINKIETYPHGTLSLPLGPQSGSTLMAKVAFEQIVMGLAAHQNTPQRFWLGAVY